MANASDEVKERRLPIRLIDAGDRMEPRIEMKAETEKAEVRLDSDF